MLRYKFPTKKGMYVLRYTALLHNLTGSGLFQIKQAVQAKCKILESFINQINKAQFFLCICLF